MHGGEATNPRGHESDPAVIHAGPRESTPDASPHVDRVRERWRSASGDRYRAPDVRSAWGVPHGGGVRDGQSLGGKYSVTPSPRLSSSTCVPRYCPGCCLRRRTVYNRPRAVALPGAPQDRRPESVGSIDALRLRVDCLRAAVNACESVPAQNLKSL